MLTYERVDLICNSLMTEYCYVLVCRTRVCRRYTPGIASQRRLLNFLLTRKPEPRSLNVGSSASIWYQTVQQVRHGNQ